MYNTVIMGIFEERIKSIYFDFVGEIGDYLFRISLVSNQNHYLKALGWLFIIFADWNIVDFAYFQWRMC